MLNIRSLSFVTVTLVSAAVSLTATACMRDGRTYNSATATPAASPKWTPPANTHGFRCDRFVVARPGWSCIQFVGKYGVRCSGYVAPGQTPNPVPAPPSYSVADVGRPGVPAIAGGDLKTISAIARKRQSRALRFVILSYHDQTNGLPRLVVFDATDGPCESEAPGYAVLNEGPHDDLFYEPGDNPYWPHAGAPIP